LELLKRPYLEIIPSRDFLFDFWEGSLFFCILYAPGPGLMTLED